MFGKSVASRKASEANQPFSENSQDFLSKRPQSTINISLNEAKSGKASPLLFDPSFSKKRLKIDSPAKAQRQESAFEDGNLNFDPSIKIDKENYSDLLFFNFGKFSRYIGMFTYSLDRLDH